MADIPNNPATALERIFWKVRSSGGASVRDVWVNVLGAQTDTIEFAQRHSEVVRLVMQLQSLILALPPEDSVRRRNEGDITAWYRAVVFTEDWTSNFQAYDRLIPDHTVRLLGSLGDNLTIRSASGVPSGSDLDRLKSSLDEWRTLLAEADLPDTLAAEVRVQVDHIEWLLGNAETYGYEPVVEQSRNLFATAFTVVKTAGTVSNISTAMVGLFQFITHLGMHDYGQAANAVAGMLSSASEVFDAANEQQKAIAGPKTKAIGAGPQKAIERGGLNELPEGPTPEDR